MDSIYPAAPSFVFNADARPGLAEAVSKEYAEYCESDEAPKEMGANEERAAKYREIYERLKPHFPTHRELGNAPPWDAG